MKKTKKKLEDLLFDDDEMTFLEKALYALIDKIKEERLEKKYNVKEEIKLSKTLDSCFNKLKLHRNFLIKKDLYDLIIDTEVKEKQVH